MLLYVLRLMMRNSEKEEEEREDEDMHAHQFLSVEEATRDPNHQQDRIAEQQQLRERQQTIGTSRKMAKRGHDGRVS